MTQKELLLHRFHMHGNRLTLSQLLEAPLGAAYRQRISDIRREGYTVECVENSDAPSNTLYILTEPTPTHFDKKSGQGEFLFGGHHGI